MKRLRAAAAILAILSLSAPVIAKKQPSATEAKFKCSNGKSMKVVFGSRTATVIYDKGKPIALPQSISGDGYLYENSKHNLRGVGDRVTWMVRGKSPVSCRAR